MVMNMKTTPTTINHDHSLLRSRSRRWRQSSMGTAVVAVAALLIATTAWLSLVFSGTTTRCWHRFKDWEATPHSLLWNKRHYDVISLLPPPLLPSPPPPPPPPPYPELTLKHIVFGIAGSSQLWKRRKEYVRLWWRPNDMRGHVWLEEAVPSEDSDDLLPPIMVSEDISRFRYTNPTGHPSGLRISRIVAECFRLKLPHVRWFVLSDDDTIFNVDNLVTVLRKYDPSEMVYIGNPSESHSANSYFSHSMAFGGGGVAISYPLAKALSRIQDDCLERYPKLYGSDDRLHACITELGIPLTREPGFHQWDIRGNAHGLLSSHPIAPFLSIHHVEAVDPFYPGLSSLESLKLFTKAMNVDPTSFLQRSICYDHGRRLTFAVSLGYVVQVFPNIVLPRELERSEQTFSAWNGIRHRNEFDFDTRDPYKSICKKPILFFLKDAGREGNFSVGSYARARGKDDLKKKFLCFPHLLAFRHVQRIRVLGHPLTKKWHLVPRRLCCKVNQGSEEILTLSVGQCRKGSSGSVADSM
ncbi:uncharacterized protein LOC115716243 [Cannabis sativa]|uniref:Uncharacterized protein n=2 Tax=Cannabis sativa TaxID=3483 RepID=A0A7J6E3R6_CANSA|nr:uncharacterized protein LOC115716243 [Cannabis sativa]XP_030500861.1 uncharacterized protein LOC115716243 [Cannabis sativa]KAF4353063.1 hypothetical protein F8388_016908 [Cannabis sativa]KAF4389509.1 hypothetical protein G4B88_006568 [Cannabis sativa]